MRRKGLDVPEPGFERPEFGAGLELFYQAFWDLNTERRDVGQPIPWSSIQSYADYLAADDTLREELHALVRALDAEHLRHKKSEHDRKNKK